MGLPEGWVTDVLPNARALAVVGAGVCPQQGLLGLRMLDGLSMPSLEDCPTMEDIFDLLELSALAV